MSDAHFPFGGFHPELQGRRTPMVAEACTVCSCPSTSSTGPDEPNTSGSLEEPETTSKTITRWSDPEVSFLLDVWAENIDGIESKNARRAWAQIAANLNERFKTSRTVAQVQRKIKYLKEKYKEAKDWNRRQTEANEKPSPFYIDGAPDTREHVVETGVEDEGNFESAQVRSERKKNKRKRSASPGVDDADFAEQRREFLDTMKDMKQQGERMTTAIKGVIASIERAQAQQTESMNMFLRAILSQSSTTDSRDTDH